MQKATILTHNCCWNVPKKNNERCQKVYHSSSQKGAKTVHGFAPQHGVEMCANNAPEFHQQCVEKGRQNETHGWGVRWPAFLAIVAF